jgi:hypothetical protein
MPSCLHSDKKLEVDDSDNMLPFKIINETTSISPKFNNIGWSPMLEENA